MCVSLCSIENVYFHFVQITKIPLKHLTFDFVLVKPARIIEMYRVLFCVLFYIYIVRDVYSLESFFGRMEK